MDATTQNEPARARHSTATAHDDLHGAGSEEHGGGTASGDNGRAALSVGSRRSADGIPGVRNSPATALGTGAEPVSSSRSHGRSAAAATATGSAQGAGTNKVPHYDHGEGRIAKGSAMPEEHSRAVQARSNLVGGVSVREGHQSPSEQQQPVFRGGLSSSRNDDEYEHHNANTVAASTSVDPSTDTAAVVGAAPPPERGRGTQNNPPSKRNDISSALDAFVGSEVVAIERQKIAGDAPPKAGAPPTSELSAAPAPLVTADAVGETEQQRKSAKISEDTLDRLERDKTPGDFLSGESLPRSIDVGRDVESRGSSAVGVGAAMSGGEETSSKRGGNERSEEKRGGHKSRKHKHKRAHDRRKGTSDDEAGDGGRKPRRRRSKDRGDGGGAGGKPRRRHSKDHGLLGAAGSPTITALAPLKRIPPPSLSVAQRDVGQKEGSGAEAAADGDRAVGGG